MLNRRIRELVAIMVTVAMIGSSLAMPVFADDELPSEDTDILTEEPENTDGDEEETVDLTDP